MSTSETEDPLLMKVPFGRSMRETHFLYDPRYNPLNHGSFGAYPKYVQRRFQEVQQQCESHPDIFIRYEYPQLLKESREAISDYLQVPADDVVLLPNASVAVNTVLRNLVFTKGDVIVHFSTVYGGVAKLIESLRETTPVISASAKITYPLPDDEVVSKFLETIHACKAAGQIPRIAIFDTISSMPGVVMPWERLTQVCKDEGILSFVDAAHGAGHLPLDIAGVQPDFLVTNLHK